MTTAKLLKYVREHAFLKFTFASAQQQNSRKNDTFFRVL